MVIPRAPGHFSAYGMLVADLRRDFVNTWFTPLADASFAEMEEIFAEMEDARTRNRDARPFGGRHQRHPRGRHALRAAGARRHRRSAGRAVQERQDRDGIKQRFDAVHQTRYGFSVPNEKAEIVSLRSATIGEMRKPAFEPIASGEAHAGGRRRARQPPGLLRLDRLRR